MKSINQLVYSIVSIFAIVSACAALPINVASIGESLIKSNNCIVVTYTHTLTHNAFLSGHILAMHFVFTRCIWHTYIHTHRHTMRHNQRVCVFGCAGECYVVGDFSHNPTIDFIFAMYANRHATSK